MNTISGLDFFVSKANNGARRSQNQLKYGTVLHQALSWLIGCIRNSMAVGRLCFLSLFLIPPLPNAVRVGALGEKSQSSAFNSCLQPFDVKRISRATDQINFPLPIHGSACGIRPLADPAFWFQSPEKESDFPHYLSCFQNFGPAS